MTDRPISELLAEAATGSQPAWDALVERFGNLVWSVARSFRLDPATASDVSQTTWLRLVENVDRIRTPEALPGWLATTARREALRVISQQQRYVPTVAVEVMSDPVFVDPSADLVEGERARALVEVFNQLSEQCRQLIRLLAAEPPLEYSDISEIIGRPVGSIGPTRQRCLKDLRNRLAAIGGGAFST
jgi:RNA polymerase sigma factor (sigma-70 family)